MKANKIKLNGEVLLDISADTVTEDTVAEGVTFHKADGTPAVGTATLGGDEFPADRYFEGGYAEVSLPNATKIKKEAFYGDKILTRIYMPKVTIIEDSAFSQCTNLALTELPSGLADIGGSSFAQCGNLTIKEFPSGVMNVGYNAFFNCFGLTTLTFKGTPSYLSSGAFANVHTITEINVPWAEGAVEGAPWGATKATINYNYTGE